MDANIFKCPYFPRKRWLCLTIWMQATGLDRMQPGGKKVAVGTVTCSLLFVFCSNFYHGWKRKESTSNCCSCFNWRTRQAKRVVSPPPVSPAFRGASSETETRPTPTTQMGGEATMVDLLLDLHSHLDAQQKDLEELKPPGEQLQK